MRVDGGGWGFQPTPPSEKSGDFKAPGQWAQLLVSTHAALREERRLAASQYKLDSSGFNRTASLQPVVTGSRTPC